MEIEVQGLHPDSLCVVKLPSDVPPETKAMIARNLRALIGPSRQIVVLRPGMSLENLGDSELARLGLMKMPQPNHVVEESK